MRRPAVFLALLALLPTLAGCGDAEPAPIRSATPTQEVRNPDSDACRRVLTDEAAQKLAGRKPELPVATRVGELDACRWDLAVGEWIQMVDVPSPQWAAQLPMALESAKVSGDFDPKALRTLEAGLAPIRAGKRLSPQRACALFGTYAREIVGARGNEAVVQFVPDRTVPQAVTAQRCTGGRYVSVTLVAADLLGNNTEAARVLDALSSIG